MIVYAPYGIHVLTERRPDLAEMSIAAQVTIAVKESA